MQSVTSITSPKVTHRHGVLVTVIAAVERFVVRFVACWHRRMSWPITRDDKTYRTCLKCGMCRQFNPQTWKNLGPFYWDVDDHKTGVG